MAAQPTPRISGVAAAPDAGYYRGVLHDLIDLGADIARVVHAQAMQRATQPDAAPIPDPTIPFDRIARCIRRTILLARSLDQPPAPTHCQATRKRIIREVEDAIQRRSHPDDSDALHAEFLERLDTPDLDDDIDERPADAIIADICRDLGLDAPPGLPTPPWKRRTPADIATLCARAANPWRIPLTPTHAADDG